MKRDYLQGSAYAVVIAGYLVAMFSVVAALAIWIQSIQ